MARLYSRKKGKSGSTRPDRTTNPEWVERVPAEVEKLVMRLGERNVKAAEIGIILRDQYAIPNVKIAANKSITKILEENNLLGKIPDDIVNLIKKAQHLKGHLEENKQDMNAKRGLQLTEAKVRRLMKYYKRVGKLPVEWKYDSKNTARL